MIPSSRSEWTEIVLTGAVGGVVGALVLLAYRVGADTNDLLNFLGGAVGAGLAVIAALWLEARKKGDRDALVWGNLGQLGLVSSRAAAAPASDIVTHLVGLPDFVDRFLYVSEISRLDDGIKMMVLAPARRVASDVRAEATEILDHVRAKALTFQEASNIVRPRLLFMARLAANTIKEAEYGKLANDFADGLVSRHKARMAAAGIELDDDKYPDDDTL